MPAAGDVRVGMNFDPVSLGPSLFGAIDLTANRARPCCPTPLTFGNSPPITTYWLLPVMVQAAWP